jgi:hypothetical protein
MAGPLGIVSGGAGAIGTLGGTLSGSGGTLGLGAGSAIGAAGQFQGAFTPPNIAIDRAPLGRANDVLQSVNERAQSRIGGARDATLTTSGSAVGEFEGAAAAAANAQGSGQLEATKSGNPGVTRRPLRSLDANGSARGDASASARGDAPAGSASAEAGGSAQTQAKVKR